MTPLSFAPFENSNFRWPSKAHLSVTLPVPKSLQRVLDISSHHPMCSIRPGPARNLLTSLSRRGITLRTSQPSFISPRTAPSIPLTWGSHQGLRYSSSHATPQSTPYGSPFSSLDQYQSRREQGERYLLDQGYDLGSAIEQPVVWGDCDMMGHLNNVQTLRYCETSRMQFV